MIHYLKHHEINRQKWDDCIQRSFNRLVYAESWYLDIVAPSWEALVEDDYISVMPLPVKRKGFHYLVQPKFIQQLGVFSTTYLTAEKIRQFMDVIPIKFILQDFNLNYGNPAENLRNVTIRNNYVLSLKDSYKDIQKRFHENTRRNIKKALNAGIQTRSSGNISEFISFYKQYSKINNDQESVFLLQQIISGSIDRDKGKMILTFKSGEIIAGAFFLTDSGRITYLTSFNTPSGQETCAMFQVMDKIIRDFSGNDSVLDFEGSMVPGIAKFFAGFNAGIVPYGRYRNKPAGWIHKD